MKKKDLILFLLMNSLVVVKFYIYFWYRFAKPFKSFRVQSQVSTSYDLFQSINNSSIFFWYGISFKFVGVVN